MKPVAVLGPTASGKSALALAVAAELNATGTVAELVSVDAMQVYRGMDIGTAKPTAAERALVVHHGLDLVDPSEEFTVAEFQRRVRDSVDDIERRGGVAILVGGTGLYLRAVIDDLGIPGQWPDLRAELERRAATELPVLFAELAALDPVAA
ncbi:MAG: tRNA (adenosine(37)-N6)-dimethylallyltransferase MiaA, partial [Actinobacteria bacterium]|nr:tRNA (adenosine(37)-N6)-dimethylallyltransferase MiaA [Actinomycetota bacterium]